MDASKLRDQTLQALNALLNAANGCIKSADILVIGCSTSEIDGKVIGTNSSEANAKVLMDTILPELSSRGIYLAVQCCEHLNRALVVEKECADRYKLQEVWVKPWLHAGGAFAVSALDSFKHPVLVENICALASAGMDIGGTLIGMHLKPVAVPVHSAIRRIGEATLIMAYSRPKYIGGSRARYE